MALLGLLSLACPPMVEGQFVPNPVQNDTLVLRNGDVLTGEFRSLGRGLVTFKTDAMATISVKWPRVVSASTDKDFEIHRTDGARFVGSIGPGPQDGSVRIRTVSDTLTVQVVDIVDMVRLKDRFFRRMNGTLDVGGDYTQQGNKVDLNLATTIRYNKQRNRIQLSINSDLTRQDSISDIRRATVDLTFSREMRANWLWAGALAFDQNSQLSLDARWSVLGGPGYTWIQTNTVRLGNVLFLSVNSERFEGGDANVTWPIAVVTDLEWFNFAGRSTDMSTRLSVGPVLGEGERWRIVFTSRLKKELLSNFYLTVGISEQYDSNPPSADANKNDFSITTGISWSFF